MSMGLVDTEEIPEEEEVEPRPRQTGIFTRRAFRAAEDVTEEAERWNPFPLEEERTIAGYAPGDVEAITLRGRANNPDPEDPDQEPAFIRNSANFLFGDEMAILGVKWDKDGMSWKMETAMDMYSEHPIRTAIAATSFIPLLGQYVKSARVGTGIVSRSMRAVSLMPDAVPLVAKHGDNWTAIADEMLVTPDLNAAAEGGKVLKYFDDDFAAAVLAKSDPEERLAMLGGRKALRNILLEEETLRRRRDLTDRISKGSATPGERRAHFLQKHFANKYWKFGEEANKAYVKNMNKFWDEARFDELFNHPLDEADHLPYFKYLNERLPEEDFLKLSPEKQRYFQRSRDRYFAHQTSTLESGFNTPETIAWVGRAHTAAVNKNSPRHLFFDVSPSVKMLEGKGEIRHYPKLYAPTLLDRKKSVDEVIEAAATGKIFIDPDEVHKLSVVKDEMLHQGYKFVRDVALKAGDTTTSRYSIRADVYEALPDYAKKSWVSMDQLPGGPAVVDRVRRMVAKASGKTPEELGDLPYMHENLIDELFDSHSGMFIQGHNAINLLSALTIAHKQSKTVYNLPSHFQNPLTNIMYCMPMAGVNPFKGDALSDMQKAHKMIWSIAKRVTSMEVPAKNVMADRNLLEEIAKVGKVDPVMVTKAGTSINLLDDLMDPRVRSILEEQSFENSEGFSAMGDLLERLARDPNKGVMGNVTEWLGNAYVKASKKINAKTGNTLSKMSAAYLAEDMTPKLATFMQLRKQGMSIEQAVLTIGRKFPQYGTVGKSIQGARRSLFPWITFPAEMTRVMKNNLVDRPLASAMWLQSAGAMQAFMSGVGLAPSTPEEVEAARESAPFWANKPSAVIATAAGQGAAGGALAGGLAGATIGTLTAGPLGFAVGSAAGAVAGAGIGVWGSSGEDSLRSWVMDFLPHSAVFPQTYGADFGPGSNMAVEALKVSPVEPYSVMMPLFRLVMGQDEYGQEIVAENTPDYVSKAMIQTLGIITPPWMQKWGLRAGTPEAGFFGLDRLSTATLGGVAGALVGYKAGGLIGAGAGAFAGTAVGSQIDTSRFEEDIGLRVNSRTGEHGNPIYDVLLNSVTGVGKSWRADPGQKAFTDKLHEDNLKTFRSSIKRKMLDAAVNGDEERWKALMQDYFMTYIQQYDDPREAQSRFSASMEDFIPQLRRNPLYKRYSEDELKKRLKDATAFAIKHRGDFADKRVEQIRKEIIKRQLSRHQSGDALGFDMDFNFNTGATGLGAKGLY